ncbi:CHAT domain-containing protein [Nostoc sp. C052]|uniref:CHAT domain-containing protein n=1 Tax=Nostoc sp. C052 TaxID=2576902 RepID=UPI002118B7C3|nr:CHAT domain-containing protein [Nostoc sp. C052]
MDHPVFSKDDDRLKPSVIQSGQNRGKNPNSTELNTLAMRRSSCDSNFSFPRLEGTHTEATNILSLVPKSSSKSAFDFDVNRTTVMNPEMSQYQIVHFATHGFFDTNNPKWNGTKKSSKLCRIKATALMPSPAVMV